MPPAKVLAACELYRFAALVSIRFQVGFQQFYSRARRPNPGKGAALGHPETRSAPVDAAALCSWYPLLLLPPPLLLLPLRWWRPALYPMTQGPAKTQGRGRAIFRDSGKFLRADRLTG